MKVTFNITLEIPDEDLEKAKQDPWRYFWSEVQYFEETQVDLDD
jgi:hypothetical protein